MANLRIRVEIQKGKRGVPLNKLAGVVEDIRQFLTMLSQDLEIEVNAGSWVGLDFADGSLEFVAEKDEPVTENKFEEFNTAFVSISEKHPLPILRRTTIAQYAKIADPIEGEEAVSFGLYTLPPNMDLFGPGIETADYRASFDKAALRWVDLTKAEAIAIQAEIQAKIRARGSLQGIIHSLFLGAQPAYFNLRELSTGTLIRCTYESRIYPEIAKALKTMKAVVHVFGTTTTDLVQRRIEQMDVLHVEEAPIVTEAEFERIFGLDPHFTGKLTTQEFIDDVRGRGRN